METLSELRMPLFVALAGYLSGIIVDSFGFQPLFVISGSISLTGAFLLLLLKENVKRQGKEMQKRK